MSEESKGRILWVDDEPTVLTVLGTLLRGNGYEFTQVDTGAEALEIIQNEKYDLIGVDVRMPDMDGLELSRKIKELNPDVPIIALSAHTSEQAMKVAEEIGVAAYIRKPFKVDELLDTIESALTA